MTRQLKPIRLDPTKVSIQKTQSPKKQQAILVQTPRAIPGFRTTPDGLPQTKFCDWIRIRIISGQARQVTCYGL